MNRQKQGYLESDFKLFHIIDSQKRTFDLHYHDFDKLIIFLKGNVSYFVEGKTYPLRPYDIILVPHNKIHRPVIHDSSPYERIIIYISPEFLKTYQTDEYDLGNCFFKASSEKTNVLRLMSEATHPLYLSIQKLEHSFLDDQYAARLYRKICFLDFMIQLNRAAEHHVLYYMHNETSHPKIMKILKYLQEHMTEPLTIERIAEDNFISPYHMMRTFKAETGYTIYEYLTEKRLLLAKRLLKQHIPVTQVCYDCGFLEYSSFLKAYKKHFDELPKESARTSDFSI